jgi:hypothetical protein
MLMFTIFARQASRFSDKICKAGFEPLCSPLIDFGTEQLNKLAESMFAGSTAKSSPVNLHPGYSVSEWLACRPFPPSLPYSCAAGHPPRRAVPLPAPPRVRK